MRVTIRDSQVLAALRPLDIAAYLRSRGWREKEHSTGRFAIWTLAKNGHELEAFLPLDDTFRDYRQRIVDLLRTLEQAEDRSQLEVLVDVTTIAADLVRIRTQSSGTEDGVIGLEAGLELVRHAREMMLAAACAALEPRSRYPSRKPDRAMEYLESLALGQTERGSYVLTIISPVPPALGAGPPTDDPDVEPFERCVTRTLAQAAAAARAAAEESVTSGEMAPFERAVEHGVSANLCDALAGLHAAGHGERLELGISWARARHVPRDVPSVVRLTRDATQVFKEASRIFRKTAPEESFELSGYVIGLKRDEGRETGTVTVSALVEKSVRKVRLELVGVAYERAIEAHRTERRVRCEGELVRSGQGFALRDPRGFTLGAGTDG
ncbi:MAG: hypothetical protein GY856_19975 [bacterium]|nr:hypothetical protein [bacterium]